MGYYQLKIGKLRRSLPVVPVGKGLKIASFNLLGDRVLVEYLASRLAKKLDGVDFDFLVGPEVKVVPLLQEMSRILSKDRYIVCRKKRHGYMVSPLGKFLVIDGVDAQLIAGKKVVVVDDVVSSGRTMRLVGELLDKLGSRLVAKVTVFKQGEPKDGFLKDLIYLGKLPIFR